VLVADARGVASFEQHPLCNPIFRRQVRANHFDRDASFELEVDRGQHHAHAAFAQDALDSVFPADDGTGQAFDSGNATHCAPLIPKDRG
jgi:hypothetical protein